MLIDTILKEIERRAPVWKEYEYDTVYFGGGTPSLLPVRDIEKILNELYLTFSINTGAEITLEANPDDLSLTKLTQLKSLGVNRLSVGIQSFFDEDLRKLNRSHNAAQALQVIENARKTGFDNLSIDLIYGIPGLTDDKFLSNIQKVLDYQIPHISAYALTVEPQTALAWQIKKQKFPPVSEEQAARQFYLLRQVLLDNGYEHYEVSNFAKPSFVSKHNSHYWQNIPYLGLGPAAHSYNGKERRWNIANNALYIKNLESGNYFEKEILRPQDIFNEYLMTGLRTSRGVNLDDIARLGGEFSGYLQKQIRKYIENQQLVLENGFLKPAPDYWFVIEGIISDLFFVTSG